VNVQTAELLISCARSADFPAPGPPEVAFLGRSNVGKSSLLNKLVNRKKLARTSSTPGKTRLLSWFRVVCEAREIHFVDLPGYGYAKVAKSERKQWKGLIEAYLGGRGSLCAAVLLQDLRRDLSEDEDLLIRWLQDRDVPVLLALTKADKFKPMQRAKRVKALRSAANLPSAQVIVTSAEKGFGVDELWNAIDELTADEL
jgi:GTP-binding protein